MAADRTRVLKRVTTILNLAEAGTYSSTLSPRNKTRNAVEIEDFVDEAGLQILQAIAERPNEYRYQFVAPSGPITVSGDALPAHIGPPAAVTITPYSGAIYTIPGMQKDYQKIESYRLNPNKVYDSKDHNVAGSTLAGFYDVWRDIFFFTGFSAVVDLARLPVRADNTTLIPEIMENTWVRLAVGEAAKVGTGGYEQNIIGEYGKRGFADLEEFKNGSRIFKEIDEPKPVSAVHDVK